MTKKSNPKCPKCGSEDLTEDSVKEFYKGWEIISGLYQYVLGKKNDGSDTVKGDTVAEVKKEIDKKATEDCSAKDGETPAQKVRYNNTLAQKKKKNNGSISRVAPDMARYFNSPLANVLFGKKSDKE